MYLKQVVIENSGPLRWLNLSLNFDKNGLPKPLVLVGGNGSGKTNLLSLVVDAIFEAAANHYDNVLPTHGVGRSWFRVVGGRTITVGQSGSFCVLRFDDNGVERFYQEKAGSVDPVSAATRVPAEIVGHLNWTTEGSYKQFKLDDEQSRKLFEQGVYIYFPSSRSEVPYWLNREAVTQTEFDTNPKFSKRLQKPIFVERALDQIKQWVISLLADSRNEVYSTEDNNVQQWHFRGNPADCMESATVVDIFNSILRAIFNENDIYVVWLGRKSPDKLGIAKAGNIFLPNLDALSTGQAILLSMFGSLLRYADMSQNGSAIDLNSIEGICLIDEIDAHVHIDLQLTILPKLIKFFPKIQFLITSHSPIFVLGLEKAFGVDGTQIVNMPNGHPVNAETYSEFGVALEALAESNAFNDRVISEARSNTKPIVYVEGETDPQYLIRAIELSGKELLLTLCDIEWIGAKDGRGQGFHTGADAMRQTLAVLKANPSLSVRKILLLNDNDYKSPDLDLNRLFVRKLPTNLNNKIVTAGIENLLSENCIRDEHFQEKVIRKPSGDVIITKTLRKADLCASMISEGTREQFAAFDPVIDIIEQFLSYP